jgi:hypothetical protein
MQPFVETEQAQGGCKIGNKWQRKVVKVVRDLCGRHGEFTPYTD